MKLRIQILPRALTDAIEAKKWYEEQREGLGLEFEQTLEAAFVGISQFPEMYPQVEGRVRRCLISHFPYGIFYEVGNDVLTIIAIMHVSREPKVWQERS